MIRAAPIERMRGRIFMELLCYPSRQRYPSRQCHSSRECYPSRQGLDLI